MASNARNAEMNNKAFGRAASCSGMRSLIVPSSPPRRDQHAAVAIKKAECLCGQTITNGPSAQPESRLGKVKPFSPIANQMPPCKLIPVMIKPAAGIARTNLEAPSGIAVEVSLGGDFATTTRGFLLVDQARRQICIDGHLFPGHGIEREPRA